MPSRKPCDDPETITVEQIEADPYPLYRRLRAEQPVAYVPAVDRWLVTRFDDCLAITKEAGALQNSGKPLDEYFGVPNILSMEGPEHRGLRASIDRVFRPQAISRGFAEFARPIARRYVEAVSARGSCDATTEILEPISVRVIGDMMGFADIDDVTLMRWFLALSEGMTNFSGDSEVTERAADARQEIDLDMYERIARLRRAPDNSALSQMIHAATPDGRMRSFDELIPSLRVIILGGFQEPGHGAANSLYGLLANPLQRAAVIAHPGETIPLAVHEGLRWIAPFGYAERRARRELEIAGTVIPMGAEIGLAIASTNRDESRYADAEQFDLFRERIPHSSFGFGAHFCSGHAVTRPLEEIALEAVFDGLGNVRLDPDREPVVHGFTVRGAWSLPIVWD